MQFVRITSFCGQLEEVIFHQFVTHQAEMTYILMQLHVKEVHFKKCSIKQQVAQVAVDTLKNFDHTFLNIQLFDNWTWRAPSFLVSEAEKEWS